jgi:hypothetical protein
VTGTVNVPREHNLEKFAIAQLSPTLDQDQREALLQILGDIRAQLWDP